MFENVQLETIGELDERLVCDGDQVFAGTVLFRSINAEDTVAEFDGEVVVFENCVAVVER